MTLEAALTLPMFLMAVIVLCSVLDLFGAVSLENIKLSNTARKAAVAAAAAGEAAPEWIDLSGTVPLRIPFGLPLRSVKAAARARVRSWTGFSQEDFSSDPSSSGSQETVYVSDYESVYHTHADCTHLDLTIIASDTSRIGTLRNEYGKKYKPCEHFPAGYTGPVYTTAKGDYYYPSLNYPALSRYVHVTDAAGTDGRPLCSRCAARDHAA